MGAGDHRDKVVKDLNFAVVTVSDTRTEDDDASGKHIMASVEFHGHNIAHYDIIKDDSEAVRQSFLDLLALPEIDVIIFTGGTGIAPRDGTPDTIAPMMEKELPGFGELFRSLSYKEIGTASMISRALGGTHGRKAVFCLPGSRNAVKLAVEEIILKEIGHIIWELRR